MATSVPLLGVGARYFLEVAQSGSVSRAAERLHVAASAVSRQVAKLEDEVGCRLFERRARGMALSEAGERLATHLRGVAAEGHHVIAGLRAPGGPRLPEVRIACTEGFTNGFLAEVIHRFHRDGVTCHVRLSVASPEAVAGLVARGDADIGLKFALRPDPGLRVIHQQAAPVYLVVDPRHPLARRRQPRLADVVAYPLGLPGTDTTLRQTLDLVLGLDGLRGEPACTGNLATLLPLLRDARMVTFAARLSVAHLLPGREVVLHRLPELRFHVRHLQVLARGDGVASPGQQTFVRHLVEAIRAVERPR